MFEWRWGQEMFFIFIDWNDVWQFDTVYTFIYEWIDDNSMLLLLKSILQTGWCLLTQRELRLYCPHTPQLLSSTHHLILSSRDDTHPPLLENNMRWNVLDQCCVVLWCNWPAICAPDLIHSAHSMGSVAPVTVTITSAPLTASLTELQTTTASSTSSTNRSAFSLLLLHTRTWKKHDAECANEHPTIWSSLFRRHLFELEDLCEDIIMTSCLLSWAEDAQHVWYGWF